ncbi:MAG: DivIVA domain-containing protein, partial [Clostridia bacterium]|nr:DivIVA domain-containing protein [Clostridia bacterium]
MNFKVVKKGYDQTQVNEYIQNITNENNEVVTNLKTEIEELKRQKEDLEQVVAGYEKKKEEIFVAFVEAQENASQLKEKAEKRFADEMERLQLFQQKWTSYAKEVSKTLAPEQVDKFEQAGRKFEEILSLYDTEVKVLVPKEVVQTQQDKTFDPLKKVAKFLNNFDNQEVATPSIREEQQVLENIVQSEALEQTSFEAEVVKEEPIEIEFLPDEPAEEKVEPVIVQTVEKQEDIKEQQL